MKFTSLTICLLYSLFMYAEKSFHFPGVTYSYAKIYYFNLDELKTPPESYIYTEEDGYAKSITGEGKVSSKALTSNIEKLFLYHKNGLLNGLSKCFTPRHGIIYFDKEDIPVASLSVCFECQGIKMWTKEKGKIKSSNPKDVKGENQLITLQNFLLNEDIIVSDNPYDYNRLKMDKPNITITYDKLDSTITQATYRDVITWCNTSFTEEVDTKITGGGDKYKFANIRISPNTKLLFNGNSSTSILTEAFIDNSEVVLPNGIHVGSTLDDLMNILVVYDGPSNPSVIIMKDGLNKIVYTFENQILILITINI